MTLIAVAGLLVLAALAVGTGTVAAGRHGPARAGDRLAGALRLVAVVGTLLTCAGVAGPAWRDSPGFAYVLVGVPAAAALLVLGAGGRWRGAAVWAGAVVVLVWSLLTALGLGGAFFLPGLLMLVAAVVTTGRRRPPPPVEPAA